jgi:serine/threonine protein kinase
MVSCIFTFSVVFVGLLLRARRLNNFGDGLEPFLKDEATAQTTSVGPLVEMNLDINLDMATVQRYECIGSGSYGQVFRAQWNDIIVALKFIELTPSKEVLGASGRSDKQVREDEADMHTRMMRRFTREVGIFSGLHHPNIITYIGSSCFFDMTTNTLRGAILMELVDGGSTLQTAIHLLASRGHRVTVVNTASDSNQSTSTIHNTEELSDGDPEKHSRDAKLLTANVLKMGCQMACGLAYLHSKAIVHR